MLFIESFAASIKPVDQTIDGNYKHITLFALRSYINIIKPNLTFIPIKKQFRR